MRIDLFDTLTEALDYAATTDTGYNFFRCARGTDRSPTLCPAKG